MTSVTRSILIVDDEPGHREFLRAALSREYSITAAANGEEAEQILSKRGFDAVITDQQMPGISGIELVTWIKERSPETPVILLTAFGSVNSAVEAMKAGAEDYLTKPVKSPDELRLVVSRAIEKRSLQDQNLVSRSEVEKEFPSQIIASSPPMISVLKLARQVAPQSTTVLLTGESGTGKEVLARFIHSQGTRPDGPFVAVNCAALTETLLESELFGHEKGAFTGATQMKRGRFELAHGGTLFLDEIGEMSANLQSKLLRVLQEQEFERVGGSRTIRVDVRIIAATNRQLPDAIEAGQFREDLYYRLSVFPIHLSPLRKRPEDILPLSKFFLSKLTKRMGKQDKTLSREAQDLILANDWPGNIRELQNALERAIIVSQSDQIASSDLPLKEVSTERILASQNKTLAELEREAITMTLEKNHGDRKATADKLGISLRTLQYRLKEYGLVRNRD